MVWPESTPLSIVLPDAGIEKSEKDDIVLRCLISRSSYFIAILTWRGLYILRPKPTCPVSTYIRSEESIDKYGHNVDLTIDGNIIAVSTTSGSVFIYQFVSSATASELCDFNLPVSSAFPGPGEAIGVRDGRLRITVIARFDSGISHMLALSDRLMVVTKRGATLQCLRWNNDEQTSINISRWFDDASVMHITYSKAMSLYSIVGTSGRVWIASDRVRKSSHSHTHSRTPSNVSETHASTSTRHRQLSDVSSATFDHQNLMQGYCIHKNDDRMVAQMTAINARFSLVAVGCTDCHILLYNVHDYHGNASKIRVLEPAATSTGSIQSMSWSPDGSVLFVGYVSGWATYSVYGKLLSSTFLVSRELANEETWLGGIRDACWSTDCIFLVPNDGKRIWVVNVLRWSNETTRPILYADNRLLIYRGHEQSDLTTIDRDALLWLTVPIPPAYVAENWPIRHVVASNEGRYVAIAGVRGLAHYSLYSGKWKMFVEEYMDKEFSVQAMVWYNHILIACVDTKITQEIRMYSRDRDLDPQNLMFSFKLDSAAVATYRPNKNWLMVYTQSNNLLFFKVFSSSVHLAMEISFTSVIFSPSRVRSIAALAESEESDCNEMNILFLVDGKLMFFDHKINQRQKKCTASERFAMSIVHESIEFFSLSSEDGNESQTLLWAFDGSDALLWPNANSSLKSSNKWTCSVSVETYPLSFMPDKGIIMGTETNLIPPRLGATFTYFHHWASTQLFVPSLLEAYLRSGQEQRALHVASKYATRKYFAHILEILLFNCLEVNDVELLKRAFTLVSQYPQEMLDVVVNCTRKTEVTYWEILFDVVGSPSELFRKCMEMGRFETAAGYLIVLHTLRLINEESSETRSLLKAGQDSGNWELCRNVARFLKAIDPSGKTLRDTVEAVESLA